MGIPAMAGFVMGMCGWAFILFEVFAGEAGKVAGDSSKVNKYVMESYSTMRLIVSVGWSIYPLGYFFGYLMGAVNDNVLNLVYNLADFVNKIAFCLAIWQSAVNSTAAHAALLARGNLGIFQISFDNLENMCLRTVFADTGSGLTSQPHCRMTIYRDANQK